MNKTIELLFSAIFGAAAFAGASELGDFSKVSEQEIVGFDPSILNETAEKTKTMDYNFDIQTIKYYDEVEEEINEETQEVIPAALAHYDYETVTHTKRITDKEWNYCRETKTLKECETEVAQIVADAKTYQIEKEREKIKQLQDDLNRTDYSNELDEEARRMFLTQ